MCKHPFSSAVSVPAHSLSLRYVHVDSIYGGVGVVVQSRLCRWLHRGRAMSKHSSDVCCCTGLALNMRPRFCPAVGSVAGWVECRCASAKVPETGKLSWTGARGCHRVSMYKGLCRRQ
jgi:hypothetical protein